MASWRTLVFGLLTAVGGAILGAYTTGLIDPGSLPVWIKSIAVLMTVIGPAGLGVVARDDKVSSEEAISKPKPTIPKPIP